jgi:hypothetical protein
MTFVAQQVLLLHHFRRILVAAAARGIDVAPLKGAHLATASEGGAALRSRAMGDVDFLVRERDYARMLEAMADLGFRPRRPVEAESWLHEVGFLADVAPGGALLFEVHRALFEPRRLRLDHEAVWARSVPSTVDGAPCRRLAPEDHVVHLCLHAALHRYYHLERTLGDVEALVRRGGASLALVARRAREWRATRATWVVADLLDRQAPELGTGRLAGWLAPPVPVRRALRAMVRPGAATPLARQSHRLAAALLLPVVLDGPADVARFAVFHPAVRGVVRRLRVSRGRGRSRRRSRCTRCSYPAPRGRGSRRRGSRTTRGTATFLPTRAGGTRRYRPTA